MSLFLLTFFLLYGGLHYYILAKVKDAFPLGAISGFILIFFAGGFILKRSLVFLTPLWLFIIPLLFSLSAGVYGFFEARDIRTERVVIKSSKIPREAGPVRIVQITDGHLGMIVRAERLSSIL